MRRKLVSTQMHRVALRYTKEELLTIFAVATKEDVDHRGHYECRGGAIYVWSHPWTHPATRYDSATIGAFYVNWLEERIYRIETDEGFELGAGEDGWEAYFEELFDRVTRGKLDEMKKEYQGSFHYLLVDVSNQFTRTGSVEEIEAIKEAYDATEGNFGVIMTHIPHSTHEDEPRILTIITDLIKKKELKSTPTWLSTSKDEKGKMVRKKEADKEAKEAEELAKELGVWDEFYGSGKATEKKKGKSKGKGKAEEEEDHSALQALILKRKEKNLDNLFDNLAAKYSGPVAKGKGQKRGHGADEEEESSRKKMRSNAPPPPEIDDEEFAKIQKKLFGDKPSPERKRGKGRKTK